MQELTNDIAHSATVTATVNAPAGPTLVPLYHPNGQATSVPEVAVASMLRDGWSREAHDVAALAEEFPLVAETAKGAISQLVTEVQQAGTIGRGAESQMRVADEALRAVVTCYARLVRALHFRYPLQEADPVTVVHTQTGEERRVDPGQVALHREQGFVQKEVTA